MSENTERDELLAVIMEADKTADSPTVFTIWEHLTDAVLSVGYRKAVRVTEFGTIFNRAAVFLNPPAESVEEFKGRYEQEFGWMLTERDPILTRTFLRCDPEPSEPVLHASEAAL